MIDPRLAALAGDGGGSGAVGTQARWIDAASLDDGLPAHT
jgi:hypothetical protein